MPNYSIAPGTYDNPGAHYTVINYMLNSEKLNANIYPSFGAYGAPVMYHNIEIAKKQIGDAFQFTKDFYDQKDGRLVYHFYVNFSKEDLNRLTNTQIVQVANFVCQYFYNKGYQICYSVHVKDRYRKKKLTHIHFALNSVNFLTGTKYRDNLNLELKCLVIQIANQFSLSNDFIYA